MLGQAIKTVPATDALVAELPEPVRRYLHHALPGGLRGASGVQLRMTGKIKVGLWLPFTAVQACDGRSFQWRASVGRGALRSISAQRWAPTGRHSHGYLTFGGDMHTEHRFGGLIIPSHFTAGWGYGTADYKRFFDAHIRALRPHGSSA
jgi:hypothetical protein